MMRAANPSPNLMELRQSELIGAIDENGIRGGYVDTTFDDGGANQKVATVVIKIKHNLLEFFFFQLAVNDANTRIGQKLLKLGRGFLYGSDFVM
jgi:hypothetical protein